MLIGFGSTARVGKDVSSDYLVQQYEFKKLAFADPLKAACREIFGFDDSQLNGAFKEQPDKFWGFSPREALQKLGTDGCRKLFGDEIWVKALMRRIEPSVNTCVSDIRFPNEARAIKSAGGILIKVERNNGVPGTTHVHISESAMDGFTDWDHVLHNNGSFADLYEQIDKFMTI